MSSSEAELLRLAVAAHKAAIDNKRVTPSQEDDEDEEREALERRARN